MLLTVRHYPHQPMPSITAACRSARLKLSSKRRTCTYSRRPCFAMRPSISRRSVANYSGRSHPWRGGCLIQRIDLLLDRRQVVQRIKTTSSRSQLRGWRAMISPRQPITTSSTYAGGDPGAAGVDDQDALSRVPESFDGYVWTNRIELIGPAIIKSSHHCRRSVHSREAMAPFAPPASLAPPPITPAAAGSTMRCRR